MFKGAFGKKYISFLVIGIITSCVFSMTFAIGVFDNPNFTIQDFCMNLASELAGLIITVLVVDTYIRLGRNYYSEKRKLRAAHAKKPAAKAKKESGFEILNDTGGAVKSISTVRDKQTGIHYLLVVHETGSGLTPLLSKDGKPVMD